MPALVQVDKRLVDLTVFLRKRNLVAAQIVSDLQVATRAFKFLEMVGDVLGRDELVPEDRTQ